MVLLAHLVGDVEAADARPVGAGSGVFFDPAAVGVAEEVVARLDRRVHRRRDDAELVALPPAGAGRCRCRPWWQAESEANARRDEIAASERLIAVSFVAPASRGALPTTAAAARRAQAFSTNGLRQGMSAPRIDSKHRHRQRRFPRPRRAQPRARRGAARATSPKAALGGTEKQPRAPRRARQAAAARPGRAAARSGLAVPRDRPARRLRPVRRRGAGRGHDRRHRPRLGPRGDDRRQRRDGEGRRLLSADGEEASARAGDRAAEPAALRLSGRQRRREPAAPGRGLPRPRAFRPHLLQPGADERRRASPRSPA